MAGTNFAVLRDVQQHSLGRYRTRSTGSGSERDLLSLEVTLSFALTLKVSPLMHTLNTSCLKSGSLPVTQEFKLIHNSSHHF